MQNGLAGLLAKGRLEILAIVLCEEITGHGLATILVNSLENLVTRGISQTREKRDKLSRKRGSGLLLEDNLVQLSCASDLYNRSNCEHRRIS